ncbi:hypothetical protein M045_gp66 [Mycobacterium phage HINdeR]|uniref:Gp68-like predicted RNA polymerase component domain-containing protein n=1 Tax=Mycobacterium phage HINdeR TaxID=1327770 RepID=R4JLK3_9CAUD|nr:hypothetical protein M045_gp66 [Mycobacterium phage HINdeR]AGK87545.1 hypothetical protein PBI_HINDER_66 [Mycobacterium phage HINdeR]
MKWFWLRYLYYLTTNTPQPDWRKPLPEKQPDQTHTRDTSGWDRGGPDPNSPVLRSPYAAHETGAVLRMQRAGFSGLGISSTLRMSPGLVMAKLSQQMTHEQEAHRRQLPIHDALVKKGTV